MQQTLESHTSSYFRSVSRGGVVVTWKKYEGKGFRRKKEKKVLKEGWSLIRVVFHWGFHCMDKKRGGLSSGWSFTGDSTVWTKRGVVSNKGGLSLGIQQNEQKADRPVIAPWSVPPSLLWSTNNPDLTWK